MRMAAALLQEVEAVWRQRPLQHATVHWMWRLQDRTVALEIADDDADRLRCQQRNAGEIGAGQPRIGLEHRQHQELRRGDAELGERALQRQARRTLGLAQEIAEIAVL